MTHRSKKVGMLVAVATAALALSGAGAYHASSAPLAADTDDHYSPANTTVTGNAATTLSTAQCGGHTPPAGTVTCFAIPGSSPVIVVFCTRSIAGGKTPATGSKPFKISPLPVFDDGSGTKPCTDSLGGTDTSVANSTHGTWTIGLVDAPNDETKTEPNAGDKLTVSVPGAGVIVTNSLGCTITVNPPVGGVFKAFKVTGAYDDHSKFTVSITNLPVTTTGGSCPLPASTISTFNAIYTFTPGVSDGS
jgi:hypothetical protein